MIFYGGVMFRKPLQVLLTIKIKGNFPEDLLVLPLTNIKGNCNIKNLNSWIIASAMNALSLAKC